MKTIGLFEIKTKLSRICDDVATTGESVLVTRRGKPLVRIVPIQLPPKGSSVWDSREGFLTGRPLAEDFVVPERKVDTIYNPMESSGK
jgi:prevent-host-death family protein